MTKIKPARGVTATELAGHLCCDRQIVSDYTAKKIIEKLPSGRFDQDACRAKVFAHLRELAAGRRGDGSANELAKEKAALAHEQRETARLKNEQTRGDLVEVKTVRVVVGKDYAVVRERILAIPGKSADECEGKTREEIEAILEAQCNEALEELHDPATYRYGRDGVRVRRP